MSEVTGIAARYGSIVTYECDSFEEAHRQLSYNNDSGEAFPIGILEDDTIYICEVYVVGLSEEYYMNQLKEDLHKAGIKYKAIKVFKLMEYKKDQDYGKK